MSNHYQFLVQQRADLVREAKTMIEAVGERGLSDEEKIRDDEIAAQIQKLDADIEREERRRAQERLAPAVPAYNKIQRGDNFATAFTHWIQTGDKSGLQADSFEPVPGASRGLGDGYTIYGASNATDMNITTAADGGNLVPTGFYNQIIARRDETMLAARLPIMRIPGVGTTVDVPYDNEADGEFVATTEADTFDLDAPALAKKSLTLLLYSKYTDVSYQLLEDTPTNLMAFLADFVGRGMAKTHNSLLLTEVAANGTSFKTFASASAIAFGEPEDIVGNNDLSPYLEEDAAVAWVTRSSTHWDIKSIVGTDRQYAVNEDRGRTLLGYPVAYSQKAAAVAASAKSLYFGNWRYVGMREGQGITFLRDPYTVAIKGQVRLLWHFRTVYGVLQAEAIGYGVHPTA
jgi:HK97 family phage major capsid protein